MGKTGQSKTELSGGFCTGKAKAEASSEPVVVWGCCSGLAGVAGASLAVTAALGSAI